MKYAFVLVVIALGIQLQSCKDEVKEIVEDDTLTQQQQASDESLMTNESEVSINEINSVISQSSFGKAGLIAGATIDDSTFIGDKKIVITYNGNSGDNKRNRTGTVSLQLVNGANWGQAQATLQVVYTNFKVLHIASGKSITLNGNYLITNSTGGRSFINPSVTHVVRGNMQVAFDNGGSATWQIARKRISTVSNNIYSITITGDTTVNALGNIAVWGKNRNDVAFFTEISTPIVYNSVCLNGPVSGVKMHKGITREITVTFGVDAAGNPVTSTCPFGFRLNWKNLRNEDKTAVLSY